MSVGDTDFSPPATAVNFVLGDSSRHLKRWENPHLFFLKNKCLNDRRELRVDFFGGAHAVFVIQMCVYLGRHLDGAMAEQILCRP